MIEAMGFVIIVQIFTLFDVAEEGLEPRHSDYDSDALTS